MKKHSKRLLVAVLTTGMLSQSVLPVMANPVSTKIVETNMAKKASSSDALEEGLGGEKASGSNALGIQYNAAKEDNRKLNLPDFIEVWVGQSKTFKVTQTGFPEGEKLKYTFADNQIAEVITAADGTTSLRGLKAGTTILTVSSQDGKITDSCDIIVEKPAEVLNFKAESAFHKNVKLTFQLKGSNEYYIERSEDGKEWTKIKSGRSPKVEYIDKEAEGGKTYKYRAVAVGSNEYYIERSEDGKEWTKIKSGRSPKVEYIDKEAEGGKTYKYRAVAVNTAWNYEDVAELEVKVNKGSIDFNSKAIYVGESYKIPVTYNGYDGVPKGEWSVADPAELEVKVNKGSIDFNSKAIYVGESYKIPVTYNGYDGVPKGEWSVADPTILSISQDGVITGLAAGKTDVTLKLPDGNFLTREMLVSEPCEVGDLKVDVAYENHVQLSWTPNDFHDAYYVARREGNSDWQRIAELDPRSASYVDTTAVAGHTYEYKVSGRFENSNVIMETKGVIVKATVLKKMIALTSDFVQTKKGEILQLPLKVEGFETAPVFTYSSDNEEVATVDAQGKVTIQKDGKAVITITSDSGWTGSCTYFSVSRPSGEYTANEWRVFMLTNQNRMKEGKAVITITSDSGWTGSCTYFSVSRPSGEYTANEWRVFMLTNQNRMKEGHRPLLMFGQMQKATDLRKKELDTHYKSDHTRPDGSSCFTAFNDVGLEYGSAGENIAQDYQSADSVVQAWMNSVGHYTNIMNDKFVHFATGNYRGKHKNWVQMFMGCDGDISCIAVLPAKANRTFKQGTLIEQNI